MTMFGSRFLQVLRQRSSSRKANGRSKRLPPACFRPRLEVLEARLAPATRTWSGAVDNIWSNPDNWDVLPVAGDDLVFSASATRLTTVNGFASGTTFNSITISGAGYTILGNAVVLTAGISATYASGSSTDRLDTTLGSGAVSVATGATLNLGGGLAGTSGVTLSGGGTLGFTGATVNTYTGTTTVNEGTLLLSKTNGALAVAGALTIGDGTGTDVVQLTAFDQIADSVNVTVNSSGLFDLNNKNDSIGGLTLTGGSVTTGTGLLTLGGDFTLNTSTTQATISGNLAFSAGPHAFAVADASVGATADVLISADLSGSGDFVKSGAGNVELAGDNSAFTGAVTVNAGILIVSSSTALGSTSAGTTIANGAELDIAGGLSIDEALTVSGTGTSGSGVIVNTGDNNTLSGVLTLAGNTTIGVAAGQLTLAGAIGDSGFVYGLTLLGGGIAIFSGSDANTYLGATTVNAGTLKLSKSGVTAVAGALVVGDGTGTDTVQETNPDQVADTSAVTVNSGAVFDLNGNSDTIGALTLTGATVQTGTGTLTLGGNVTTNASTAFSTISGNLDLGGATRTFTIAVGAADPDLLISADIIGTGGIIKTGGGTGSNLSLTGNNTYDGTTDIQMGSITVSSNNALGSTAAGTTVASGATLALMGGISIGTEALSLAGSGVGGGVVGALSNPSGTNSYAGSITLAAGSVIGVGTGSTLTLSGVITDGGNTFGITKIDSGTLVLTNANTYDSTTTINAGIVSISNDTALGTAAAVVASGAALQVSGDITVANALTIGGSGVGGNGVLRSTSGTNTITGTVTLSAGSVLGVDAGTLNINRDRRTTFGVTKVGAGRLDYNAANIYTGTTTVSAGILGLNASSNAVRSALSIGDGTATVAEVRELANNQVLDTSSVTLRGAGALFNLNGFNDQVSGLTMTGGSVQTGAGTLTLTSTVTTNASASTATISGKLALSAAATTSVADGTAATDLDINALISGAGTSLTKSGAGTMQFSGTSANTYSGMTNVNAGTLILAKSDDVSAIPGTLVVGDNIGGGESVRLEANNQIVAGGGGNVTVNEAATLNFNGFSDTLDSFTLQGGTVQIPSSSVTVITSITSNATTVDQTSLISGPGALDLNGTASFSFTVASDSALAVDLRVSAEVQNGGVTKADTGILAFSGTNTYTGSTTVNAGALQVESNSALGTTAGSTSVASSASVFFSGASLNVAEPFSIAGTGLGGSAVLGTLSGSATLTGTVDMTAASRFGASSGATLTVNGVIDDGGNTYALQIANGATGRTVLGGNNQFDGDVDVFDGFLRATHAGALGDTTTNSTVTIQDGASLELSGGITIPATKALDLQVNGVSGSSKIVNVAGNNTYGGASGSIVFEDNTDVNVASGTTLNLSSPISESAAGRRLIKVGSGTLDLTATNSYTGTTFLNAGTLLVDGSIATSSDVNISGGTLGGSGTVPDVTVASGGSVAPGASPGILNSGDVAFASGSTFSVELNGTTAGTQYDQLNVTGTVDLNSDAGAGATLSVALGFTPSAGNTFVIISNDGSDAISNTFHTLAEGATFTVGGTTFRITYVGGSNGNDVVLTALGTPTVMVASSANPSTIGQSVMFTVTVSGSGATPTGDVDFYDGDPNQGGTQIGTTQTLNGSGQTSVSTSTLTVGTHQIFVTYAGDSIYTAATGTLSGGQTVNKISTTTAVSSSQAPSTYGDSVTFTALVMGGTPTGTVDFFDGVTQIGSGTVNGLGIATYTTSALFASGTPHSITATYQGNSTYAASTSLVFAQTVNKATLTVTADNQSRVYGDANPTFTATFAGFKNGETLATSGVTGTPNLTTTATATSSVSGSPYTITVTAGTLASGNYSFSLVNGQLTVTKATLTVTADNQSRVYGDANPTFTATFSGFKNSETLATSDVTGSPSLTTTATPASPVSGSPYTITAAAGTLASGNYSFSLVNGQLTVTKATLTVTADDQSRHYGAANPTFTATFSGFKNSETLATSDVTGSPSLTTTATPTSPVSGSPYTITAAAGTLASGNYSFSFANGQLTVTTATLTVTADDLSRAYGDANPTLTATFSGFQNGETLGTSDVTGAPSLTTTVTPTSSVAGSPYTITVVAGTLASSNYSFSFADGQLTVTTATLTVTANNQSRVFGAANPTFTATITGFKNGETLATSGVTGSPSVTTTATSSSPVSGSPYTITAAVGSLTGANYTFGFVNGQLTVTQGTTTTGLTTSSSAPATGQSVTFTATVAVVAPSAGTPTGTVTFLNGTTVLGTGNLVGGTATFSTTTLPPGRYQVTATYNGDGNFAGSTAAAVHVVVGTQTERFVAQAYVDLLGRAVDPTGLSAWVGLLNQGGSRTQVALGIEGSTEYRTLQVQAAYSQYLHRAADAGGLSAFVSFLTNGGTVEQLQSLLVGSPEYFQTRGGSTTNGFLDALYQDALGRAIDPTGQTIFTQALANGATRSQVADAIFSSTEYFQDLVQAIFQKYLGRSVDPVGLSAFTSLLQSGTRDEVIIASVVGSDEYFGQV